MSQPFISAMFACFILLVAAEHHGSVKRPARQTSAGSQVASNTQDARLRQLANDWKDAYNSRDAAKVASLYTEDAYYISSHVRGLDAKGREQIKTYFQDGMDVGGHIDAVMILTSKMSCNLASVVCKYEATNSGKKVSGRNVLVLKKVSGKWLIASHMTVVAE